MNRDEIIRNRATAIALSKSADPTKRLKESRQVAKNPLDHMTNIYDDGGNREHRTPEAPWYKGLGLR